MLTAFIVFKNQLGAILWGFSNNKFDGISGKKNNLFECYLVYHHPEDFVVNIASQKNIASAMYITSPIRSVYISSNYIGSSS